MGAPMLIPWIHLKDATPEKLARALLRPVRRRTGAGQVRERADPVDSREQPPPQEERPE